jgi:outer membrane protein TolC
MKERIFPLAIFLYAAWAGTGGTEVWTLDRTIQTAVSASTGSAINRMDAEAARLDIRNAEAGWYPGLSFSGSANYVNKVMEINMIPGRTIRFGDNDSYDFKVKINQLIYDSGRLASLRESGKNRVEMSIHQAEAVELAVEFQAKTAFFSVAAARENINAARQSIAEAESHLASVEALRGQGMALEDDVLLSKLRVSQANMSLVSQQAERDRALASFRKTLGLPFDSPVDIEWKADNDAAIPDDVTVEAAYSQRPEFKSFEAALRLSETSAKAARSDKYPTLGLMTSYDYGKPGLDQPANKWMDWFSAGISLNWNVWDWGKVDREIAKAEISRSKTRQNITDLERSVSRQLSEAMIGYTEARQRRTLANQSSDYAKRHLDLVNASFKNGAATERDYDAAFAEYTRSMADAAAAGIVVQVCRAQVEYVLGIRYRGGKNE